MLGRRSPVDRQDDVNACVNHVLELFLVPCDRLVREVLERGGMGGERIAAVAIKDMSVGHDVVPVEVMSHDDLAIATKSRVRAKASASS